jgi:hypothetical protein
MALPNLGPLLELLPMFGRSGLGLERHPFLLVNGSHVFRSMVPWRLDYAFAKMTRYLVCWG